MRRQRVTTDKGARASSALAWARRFGVLAALLAHPALAQFSGKFTLLSDYRYRGVSLSDARAAPQLNLAYDSADNWYAGASATRLAQDQGPTDTQLISYAGYARRIGSALSWEAGAVHGHYPRGTHANYTELYAGLSGERISARVYVAPAAPGHEQHGLYGEVNASYPLGEQLQLLGHLGVGRAVRAQYGERIASTAADAQIGIWFGHANWQWQLALLGVTRRQTSYPGDAAGRLRTLLVSIGYAF